MATLPAKIVIALIRFYCYCISPCSGWHCRFTPSCSYYTITAIKNYGLWYGCYLSLRRLCCCHPWHRGGIDNVPLIKE